LLDAIIEPFASRMTETASLAVAQREALPPGEEAETQFKIDVVTRLAHVLVDDLPRMRALAFDSSTARALHRPELVQHMIEFEHAFAGTTDDRGLTRHRCALAAIQGGLLFTATAFAHQHPDMTSEQTTAALRRHLPVIIESSLKVLDISSGARTADTARAGATAQ
jgi:hypothetical protein